MAEQKNKLERAYNIPLRKEVQKSPDYRRAKRAISVIKKFVSRHMKPTEIKIGRYLNEKIWEHGIKNVPHHIKVECSKDEKGIVNVELFGAPKKTEEPKKDEKKTEKKGEAKQEIVQSEKKTEMPETSKDIQKEEIKELQREKPKVHKEKTESKSKSQKLRKKELIPAQGGN